MATKTARRPLLYLGKSRKMTPAITTTISIARASGWFRALGSLGMHIRVAILRPRCLFTSKKIAPVRIAVIRTFPCDHGLRGDRTVSMQYRSKGHGDKWRFCQNCSEWPVQMKLRCSEFSLVKRISYQTQSRNLI